MDKFLALQQQYVDDKAKYYNKKFKDCVVVDTYPSDVKGLLKNLVQVHKYEADEMDPKDLNVIMMYRPMLGDLWIQKFKSKIEMSKKELDAIESGEIPELTLADMSNPQRELTNEMYYNYLRSEFVKSDQSDLWVLAMLCNNIVSIGNKNDVTYSMTYFSTKEGVNYDYFDNLRKEVAEYCKTNKCNTIQYYLSKDHVDLTNILYQGIVASMDQSHAFQSQKDLYNILPSKNWFQPSEEWLNKYKIIQLRLLAHKIKCKLLPHDNKKLVIDKLILAFKEGAVFDPIKFLDTVK
jgi:hypothetical protein